MRVLEITLQRTAVDPVLRGHPWVWQDAIVFSEARAAGDEVALLSHDDRKAIGTGLFDPDSPIAVRVWTSTGAAIDAELVRTRLSRAVALRRALFEDGRTTAYRLVNGEGDRMPGVVIDRYANAAIVRPDGAAAEALVRRFREVFTSVLVAEAGVHSIALRTSARGEAVRLEELAGGKAPDTVVVLEHGVPFVVDLAKGQKTGAFLDQRENRRRVGALAAGRDVLNLFSYAGGFSLHAAKAGARSITSVDIAAGAHATAHASFREAGLDPQSYEWVTADVTAFLKQAKSKGSNWDLVVSDPPSFAPSERTLPRALASYRALHRACAAVLAPGGIFCASSCSSHVNFQAFTSTLDDAALGRSDLVLTEVTGQPHDHPTLAAWPEGRYLKFAILR
jgi:23S rRNA (cytosine1962-C5)-methyltransferase